MTAPRTTTVLTLLALSLCFAEGALAAGKDQKKPAKDEQSFYESKTKWFTLRLVPRTPEQIAGFYEGRGFAAEAIDHVRSRCFVTALLRNYSDTVVWLELANWQFSGKDGPLQRVGRPQWKQEWTELGLPAAHQSTFSWTLMPESRDLRPEEPVGGNITLPPVSGPVTLKAVFYLGADKNQRQEVEITGELCRR